jgi:hypothetical protein
MNLSPKSSKLYEAFAARPPAGFPDPRSSARTPRRIGVRTVISGGKPRNRRSEPGSGAAKAAAAGDPAYPSSPCDQRIASRRSFARHLGPGCTVGAVKEICPHNTLIGGCLSWSGRLRVAFTWLLPPSSTALNRITLRRDPWAAIGSSSLITRASATPGRPQ